ncbi:GumC family protein [Olleya namhaensis]|uniref:GumC family protein n=1 Tax=Olleya namhaensis TaxID=1144750 RepID=UPI002492490B|nr:tyrosine-protein kinase [Olleya namhaensis]
MDNYLEHDPQDQPIDIKGIANKYLAYWYWIALSGIIALVIAFLYLRYTPDSYKTAAKVKVLTEKESTDLNLDLDKLLGKGNVNLENERAVLQSFRLNRQVVNQLNLQVQYFQSGHVNQTEVFTAPFKVTYVPELDKGSDALDFQITVQDKGYSLVNLDTEATLQVPSFYLEKATADFPFTIQPTSAQSMVLTDNPVYEVTIISQTQATQNLVKNIKIAPDGKDSDILILSLEDHSKEKAQSILNTLIDVYTQDGITDRQEVSKRTIAFIDERFTYLTTELDSIEIAKGSYKQNNNLSIFEADAASVIQKKSIKDEQLFEAETQMLLADVLDKSISGNQEVNLLPANIGLNSGAVNTLVSDYNTAVLEYNKWKATAGDNNPKVKILKASITDLNNNIQRSLSGYKSQLEQSLKQNRRAQGIAQQSFKTLPNKEKILRSIERQQILKENLYLLLLQKREEAAITMAVTAANVKVIDYAITNSIPVAPKRKIVLLAALLLGLGFPIGILYLKFLTNTKIYTSKDVESINPNTGIVGEIPVIPNAKQALKATSGNTQTEEAFRTLIHNLNFTLDNSNPDQGQIIAVTSSVKGEGKTTVAFNIAQTYFHLKKKVLLVGADLRNPQLHTLIDSTKDNAGLSNYLSTSNANWEDTLIHMDANTNQFDLLLSGPIPPMPTVLLSSTRFQDFLKEAKAQYDYVIVDTAPTLLVADTLTFVDGVDFTAYVVRSGVTEKPLIEYSKKLVDQKKIKNMGYIINDIDFKGSYGYGYNYGYGYGYHAETVKKKWYRFGK